MRDAWRAQLEEEFNRARSARINGKEGQARVCARRAAGIAIREYYSRRGMIPSNASAYDLLNRLASLPETSLELKRICNDLTMRVSEEFKLPVEVDLVEESRQLCMALLPDWNP